MNLDNDYDYIVVGSGAGGGTVAARLAEAGMKVFLLEAGGDPRVQSDETPGLADQYQGSRWRSNRISASSAGARPAAASQKDN